jgi:SWI/SNF-related matrix-associated actin-dependent regulator of chromatin subfamily A protein 2/4
MNEDLFEVERIIGKKFFNDNKEKKSIAKYKVKWKNYPDSKSTWEPVENLLGVKHLIQAYEDSINPNPGKKVSNVASPASPTSPTSNNKKGSQSQQSQAQTQMLGKKRNKNQSKGGKNKNVSDDEESEQEEQEDEESNNNDNDEGNESDEESSEKKPRGGNRANNKRVANNKRRNNNAAANINNITTTGKARMKSTKDPRTLLLDDEDIEKDLTEEINSLPKETKAATGAKGATGGKGKLNSILTANKNMNDNFNINNIHVNSPSNSNSNKENKTNGDFNTDKPKRIKNAKQHHTQDDLLLCEVEWQARRNGEIPENSFITNKELKSINPMLLCEFYEERLKIPKRLK